MIFDNIGLVGAPCGSRDLYVHGFIPAFKNRDKVRGILTNAIPHAGHDWLINVDLKDFFHTIKLDSVNNYFRSLGYEEEVVKTLINQSCPA